MPVTTRQSKRKRSPVNRLFLEPKMEEDEEIYFWSSETSDTETDNHEEDEEEEYLPRGHQQQQQQQQQRVSKRRKTIHSNSNNNSSKQKKERRSPSEKAAPNELPGLEEKTVEEKPAEPQSLLQILPKEVLQNILLYLDNPRDIFNLVIKQHNRQLYGCLSDEVVVRAAVFGGGIPRQAFREQLIPLIQGGAIHVPSTYRLLRLACNIYCERGDECALYNLASKRAAYIRHQTGSQLPLGMSLCYDCLGYLAPYMVDSSVIHDARFAVWNAGQMLVSPLREAVTNVPIGPRIMAMPIRRIIHTYHQPSDRARALDDLVKQQQQQQQVSSRLEQPTEATRGEQLVVIYNQAEAKFAAFTEAKLQAALRRRQQENAAKTERRMTKLRNIYQRLSDRLEGHRYKEYALRCTWHEATAHSAHVSCVFHNVISMQFLGHLMNAPSQASLRKIDAQVEALMETLDLLHGSGFLEDNFLSFLLQPQLEDVAAAPNNNNSINISSNQRPSVASLGRYCRQKFTTWESLLGESSPLRGCALSWEDFLQNVRDGNKVQALCCLLCWDDLKEAFLKMNICEAKNKKYKKVLTRIWQRSNRELRERFQTLAASGTSPATLKWRKFDLVYQHGLRAFRSLKRSLRDYRNYPEYQAFLAESGPPEHHPDQIFSRRQTLNETLGQGLGEDLLRSREFAALLTYHRHMFANPGAYGVDPMRRRHGRNRRL